MVFGPGREIRSGGIDPGAGPLSISLLSLCLPRFFLGFGAMEVTKPYKFIGFGATEARPTGSPEGAGRLARGGGRRDASVRRSGSFLDLPWLILIKSLLKPY